MTNKRSMELKILTLLILVSFLLTSNNNTNQIVATTNSIADNNVSIDGVVSPSEYENSLYLDGLNQYKMSFTVDNSTGIIYFGLEVNTRGWIGLGLNPTNVSRNPPHAGADIIQGGYSNGVYIHDEYGNSQADIRDDGATHQDFIAYQASENSSWTTLEFSRYMNTGDSHDEVITPDQGIQVIWSFKSSDAYQDHHDHQGSAFVIFFNDTFVPPTQPPSNDNNTASTFNVVIDGTVNPGEYPNSLYMDSLGQYKLNYGIVNGTMYLGIQVKALGWVGIGFKTSSPAVDKHLGADIMLGAYVDANGSTVYRDDYGNTQTTHVPDTSLGGTKDIVNAKATQNATMTTFEFSKPLDTGDQYDQVITPESPIYVMWSYHLSIDDCITQHTAMGFNLLTFHEFTGNTSTSSQSSMPFAPQSLSGSYSNQIVNLNWLAPPYDGGSPITDYNVYRSLNDQSLYLFIGQSSDLNFSDSSMDSDVVYYYVVTAVNNAGESQNSNALYIRTTNLATIDTAQSTNIAGAQQTDVNSTNGGLFPSLPIGLSWGLAIPAMYATMFVTLAGAVKYKSLKSR